MYYLCKCIRPSKSCVTHACTKPERLWFQLGPLGIRVMQTDNNISKYKCTEWLSDHIGLRHLAYASLTSFMQTYFQSNTSIHIFHKHFMNKKEIKQLSVLSQDFSPLSTPRTEQQKGDSSVIHLLVFSETCHSPGLTYPVHVREVGGLNNDISDKQGPYGLQYKSVPVLLSLQPYSAYYSEVFLKLWFNNLLGFELIFISSFIETYWQPLL